MIAWLCALPEDAAGGECSVGARREKPALLLRNLARKLQRRSTRNSMLLGKHKKNKRRGRRRRTSKCTLCGVTSLTMSKSASSSAPRNPCARTAARRACAAGPGCHAAEPHGAALLPLRLTPQNALGCKEERQKTHT